jgi:outer membrane biosynthesis protein TonB
MVSFIKHYPGFKRAVIISISAHVFLFILALLSPSLPKFGRKRMVHYVNLISFPGGGGGGGSPAGASSLTATRTSEEISETPVQSRESLRDLTTPAKLKQQTPSALRHPVDKPKREKKVPVKKKTSIQKRDKTSTKPPQTTKSEGQEGSGTDPGSGVRLGVGSGSGGGIGFGSEFASQIGLSNFPYTYYLQLLVDRISSNWIKSQVSPGTSGDLHTTVFFKIYRDGKISIVEIEEKCGIHALDLAAVRAVQSSAPFAPLPTEYEDDYLGIHLIFEHGK